MQETLALQAKALKIKEVDQTAETYLESSLKATINGFMYCNAPVLQLQTNNKVRWIVLVSQQLCLQNATLAFLVQMLFQLLHRSTRPHFNCKPPCICASEPRS